MKEGDGGWGGSLLDYCFYSTLAKKRVVPSPSNISLARNQDRLSFPLSLLIECLSLGGEKTL